MKKAMITALSHFLPLLITVFLFAVVIGLLIGFMDSLSFSTVWGNMDSHVSSLLFRLVSSTDCLAAEEEYPGIDFSSSTPLSTKRAKIGLIDNSKLSDFRIERCFTYSIKETSGSDIGKIGSRIGYSLDVSDLDNGISIFSSRKNECSGSKCSSFELSSPSILRYEDGKRKFVNLKLKLFYELTK